MNVWQRIAATIDQHGAAALISVSKLDGSGPRDAGARIVVQPGGGFFGTVGGGALEYASLQEAARLLETAQSQPAAFQFKQSLGPDLGQCCGGHAILAIETFNRADMSWIRPLALAEQRGPIETYGRMDLRGRILRRLGGAGERERRADELVEVFGVRSTQVLLFGAGHVGRALVLALAPLPFQIDWVDSRVDAFPSQAPANVRLRMLPEPATALVGAERGTLVVIMTHSHPLDLAISALALADDRFPYVGLIGSKTKRNRFVSQMRKAGITDEQIRRLHCPIGGRELRDKSPPVIAAATAVELLAMREAITPST